MAMPGNRNTIVGHRLIAFDDQIRLDIRMLRTRYLITLARNETTVETHLRRAGNHLATMVGIITDSSEVHHRRLPYGR